MLFKMISFLKRRNLVASTGLLNTPFIEEFLGGEVFFSSNPIFSYRISNVVGWGAANSGQKARALANRLQRPLVLLEDGFLRSLAPGYEVQPLSMVKDFKSVYFDCNQPSSLEFILSSETSPLNGLEADVRRARQLIVENRLSKYNHAPRVSESILRSDDIERVLVIDQTMGDKSVALGGASGNTFNEMLSAALSENPRATIYVKTHPEVSSGKKDGYLSNTIYDRRVVLIRQLVNPLDLLSLFEKVYCVTSTMGFEALLMDKKVICFGMPWYSGWGATDDRQKCLRRNKLLKVDELMAAAYFHYSVYLNPYTLKRGDIFDVIRWFKERLRN